MILAVLSIFALGLVAPWLVRLARDASGWLLALLPLAITAYFATFIGRVAGGDVLRSSYRWVASLDVNFSFYLDGLGLLMALLVSGIGALVVIYAGGYMAGDKQTGRFFLLLFLFMGAMLGVVLADNVIILYVFWELTSLTSFLLIGFKHESETSRRSALQALLVTTTGGLSLLAGVVLLGLISGSWELSALLGQGDLIRAHPLYLPALALILLGAFTKSAQFPFHFWLPNAMAAPTPVSAYLHSATMVKAGVYLLARFTPIMGGTPTWLYTLIAVGIVTALLGAWLSWQKLDLKQILAYSTISALGLLVMLLGLGTNLGYETAVLFLLVHALYKGALFMTAGAIEHETGSRNVARLGGLARLMPVTLLAVLLAALSMSGLPPLIGFISKELVYEAVLDATAGTYGLLALTLLTNVFLVTTSAIVAIRPFFGRAAPLGSEAMDTKANPNGPAGSDAPITTEGGVWRLDLSHEAPVSMWIGPLILGLMALLFGLLPALIGESIVAAAASSIAAASVRVQLALWHGFNVLLVLSIVTVAAGLGLYLVHRRLLGAVNQLDAVVARVGPAQWYEWGLGGLRHFGVGLTRVLQNGHLHFYLLFVNVTVLGLVGYTMLDQGPILLPATVLDIRFHEVVVAVLILIAAFIAVRVESRLTAVAALGVVGLGVGLLFMLYGAPDLAMTQIAIETLTVILLVLVLYRLPGFSFYSSWPERSRDALVALVVGSLMTILVLASTAIPAESRLTIFFAENSVPLGHGRNIVNVILVDFRGMDTMVEITVLAVAAIGVYALLKLRPRSSSDTTGENSIGDSETRDMAQSPISKLQSQNRGDRP